MNAAMSEEVMTCVVCGEDTTRVQDSEPYCMNCYLEDVCNDDGYDE